MARAFVLGAASGLPLLALREEWALVLLAVAGALAAWMVASKLQGLLSVLGGVGASFAVAGGREVIERIEFCGAGCSGLSSPNFTLVIVVGFTVLAMVVAAGGYAAGRLLHWLLIGRTRSPRDESAR